MLRFAAAHLDDVPRAVYQIERQVLRDPRESRHHYLQRRRLATLESERGGDMAAKILASDCDLLSFQLDDKAVEFSLILRALRIRLAARFGYDSARDGIARGKVLWEIDFDLAWRRGEVADEESVGGV